MSAPTSPSAPATSLAPGAAARTPWRPGPPLLAAATTLVVLLAWSGMVTRPGLYLLAAASTGVVVALAGSLLRRRALPAYAVTVTQLAVAVLGLNLTFAGDRSLLGVVPTWDSLTHLDLLVVDGARALDYYAAPVARLPAATAAFLAAVGLGVLLLVDLLACGLRRPALAALPLLGALAVPISILNSAVTAPVFVVSGLLFLRLLATAGAEDAGSTGTTGRPGATWWGVGVAAVLLALVAAPLVPVGTPLHRGGLSGDGTGSGGEVLDVVNPFVRLRRDLLEQRHVPLLYATTEGRRTSYLTTTVLDRFTAEDWRPSPRILPAENDANAIFPNPPGLSTTLGGLESQWQFELAPRFATQWLPLPAPVRQVTVPGDWRYDSRTLDVAHVGGDAARPLTYSATSFEPALTPQLLRSAVPAPTKLRAQMTALPSDFPSVIARQARAVTRGANTDYDKAVALQDWFRTGGGFTYSLEQRQGSGLQLLADFVTTSRVGYCEQYAAAMAAMGRSLGIPSRVAVGFLAGERQPDGRYLYTSDDRHAWPEMYFSGAGWVRFEPTPASRTGNSPAYTRQAAGTPSTGPAPSAEPSLRPSARPTPSSSAAPTARTGTTRRPGSSGVPWKAPLAALVVLLLAAAPGLLRREQRRRRLHPPGGDGPADLLEGAWAELRATALDLGLDWDDDRSPREQARALAERVEAGPADLAALHELLRDLERSRYGGPAGRERAPVLVGGGPAAGGRSDGPARSTLSTRSVTTDVPAVRAGAREGAPDDSSRRVREVVEAWRDLVAESVGTSRGARVRRWRAVLLPASVVTGRDRS